MKGSDEGPVRDEDEPVRDEHEEEGPVHGEGRCEVRGRIHKVDKMPFKITFVGNLIVYHSSINCI